MARSSSRGEGSGPTATPPSTGSPLASTRSSGEISVFAGGRPSATQEYLEEEPNGDGDGAAGVMFDGFAAASPRVDRGPIRARGALGSERVLVPVPHGRQGTEFSQTARLWPPTGLEGIMEEARPADLSAAAKRRWSLDQYRSQRPTSPPSAPGGGGGAPTSSPSRLFPAAASRPQSTAPAASPPSMATSAMSTGSHGWRLKPAQVLRQWRDEALQGAARMWTLHGRVQSLSHLFSIPSVMLASVASVLGVGILSDGDSRVAGGGQPSWTLVLAFTFTGISAALGATARILKLDERAEAAKHCARSYTHLHRFLESTLAVRTTEEINRCPDEILFFSRYLLDRLDSEVHETNVKALGHLYRKRAQESQRKSGSAPSGDAGSGSQDSNEQSLVLEHLA